MTSQRPGPTARFGAAEIGGFELGIGGKCSGAIGAHDAARFQQITAVGDGQGQSRHLIDQENGDARVAQLGQNVEQFVDHAGRKTERRFIEEDDAGLRHQAARDGQHLLLPTGKQASPAVQTLAQARKALQHALDIRLDIRTRPRIGAE